MITLKEILNGHDIQFVPIQHQQNLEELQDKINRFETACGLKMIRTSGYRSLEEHLAIYKKKGITDKNKIPMKSKHLTGQACDFADPNANLVTWVQANERLVLGFGLWAEHWTKTAGWLHLQSVPYGSWVKGKSLWFMP